MGGNSPVTLGALFKNTCSQFADKKALLFKSEAGYGAWTWLELSRKVSAVATFFLANGVKSGDRIAILSENRPEWAVVDLAAQTIGAGTVPIYTSLTPAEIQFILLNSEASVLALSSKTLLEKT